MIVTEDGPAFVVGLSWESPEMRPVSDLVPVEAIAFLERGLAEARWCLEGYKITKSQPVSDIPLVLVEGVCK